MKTEYRAWLAKRLKQIRIKMGWSQNDAAEIAEKKLCTWQAYEEERAETNIRTLKKFCQAAGMTVDAFLEGSPE